ncbi:MAG TPA: hypothetical protein VGJ07_22110 [Rugosimonospora sp.]
MTVDELARSVDRLVGQIAQWTQSRWATSTASGGGTRAAAVHALAQRLADLEAGLTGHPTHEVPRLESDLVLPDQVKVIARDLLVAGPTPEVIADAAEAVAGTRSALNGT